MPGPAPKPPAKRQRRNKRDAGEVVVALPDNVPEPPTGLQVSTRKVWIDFWSSPLVGVVQQADRAALDRLFVLIDEHDRIWRAARKVRMVSGSQGQPVLNPLYKEAQALRGEIRNLEDRFGLTPMSRLKLGVTFGAAKRSLAEEMQDEADDDDYVDEDADLIAAIDAESEDLPPAVGPAAPG